MKNKTFIILTALVIALVAAAFAIPDRINYQGILRNTAGDLQDGNFTMRFRIYDDSSGGNLKYDSGYIGVPVSNGLYSVDLGPVTGEVFDGGNRWLLITVGTDDLLPRLKVNSVAYAIMADSAVTATSANYAAVSGQATNAATADYATVSGTATDAAHATDSDTVAGTSVGSGVGNLLPLSSVGGTPGYTSIPISAEAIAPNFALFVNGRLGANSCVGTATMSTSEVLVNNTLVTNSSIILVTPQFTGTSGTYKWVKIATIEAGSFTIGTYDGSNQFDTIDIQYLIIN